MSPLLFQEVPVFAFVIFLLLENVLKFCVNKMAIVWQSFYFVIQFVSCVLRSELFVSRVSVCFRIFSGRLVIESVRNPLLKRESNEVESRLQTQLLKLRPT